MTSTNPPISCRRSRRSTSTKTKPCGMSLSSEIDRYVEGRLKQNKTSNMRWSALFGLNIGSNIAGGLVIALLVLLLNDLSIAPKPLSGLWSCTTEVVETNLPRYQGLKTGMVLAIVSGFDNRISGTLERYWDETAAGVRATYRDEKIVHGVVTGHYERRLLFNRRRNGIQLHIQVEAHNRPPSYILDLRLRGADTMDGAYVGTVAKFERGNVTCTRASTVTANLLSRSAVSE